MGQRWKGMSYRLMRYNKLCPNCKHSRATKYNVMTNDNLSMQFHDCGQTQGTETRMGVEKD